MSYKFSLKTSIHVTRVDIVDFYFLLQATHKKNLICLRIENCVRYSLSLKIYLCDYMTIGKVIKYNSSLRNTIISLFFLIFSQKFTTSLDLLNNCQQIKSRNLSHIIDVSIIFTFEVTFWLFFKQTPEM